MEDDSPEESAEFEEDVVDSQDEYEEPEPTFEAQDVVCAHCGGFVPWRTDGDKVVEDK